MVLQSVNWRDRIGTNHSGKTGSEREYKVMASSLHYQQLHWQAALSLTSRHHHHQQLMPAAAMAKAMGVVKGQDSADGVAPEISIEEINGS
ncbi:hypothetical protein Tco_0461159 [Tanacetum coccineum]